MDSFLAGLAFAKTLGGDMVIWIRAGAGVPEETIGIEIAARDGENSALSWRSGAEWGRG